MPATTELQSPEKESFVNGKSHVNGELTAEEVEPKLQCCDETVTLAETPSTESLADWFVMICVFFCNVLNGINYATYGVLYLPIADKFNSSRAAVGWISSFDFALGTFLGIFISYPVNILGCRLPATVGSLLIAVSGMLSCFSPNLIWLYILKGIIPGIGQSMGLLTCNVIIQQRFHKSRSLATGVSIMGWSVGNFFGAPLTELLLNMYGLHGTLAMLGAIQAHRIPLALQFRSPKRFVASKSSTEAPESEKRTACDKLKCYIQGSLDFTLLRKTTFLLFCISGLLQKFVVNCYVPHTVNWALAAGVPRYLAVWAVSTLSCATTVCRIFVSLIADREFSNRLVIYAIGLFFEFLMCIPLLVFPGISGTFMSVVLFGLHAGCTHTLSSVVLVDLQGVENIARCFALFCAFLSLGLLTGSPFMGFIYDVTASYNIGFVMLCCIGLTAFAIMIGICIMDHVAKKSSRSISTTEIDYAHSPSAHHFTHGHGAYGLQAGSSNSLHKEGP